jgi:tRNA(adenine34) deaminase
VLHRLPKNGTRGQRKRETHLDKDMLDPNGDADEYFMDLALKEAKLALIEKEVPIGAIVVREGKLIASAHNLRESLNDPTAHAEILALRKASESLGSWRLSDCTVYVNLEPCPMCAGALISARVRRVVYASSDPKAGALGTLYNLGSDPRLNHELEIRSAVLEEYSSNLISEFFRGLRTR